MSNAKDIVEDSQPSVASNSEFLDAEDLPEESTNRCERLQLIHGLRTMLLVQDPSKVHQELSIQVFERIVPLA
jgi:hypothetical protein